MERKRQVGDWQTMTMRAAGRTWRQATIVYNHGSKVYAWILISELARRSPHAAPVLNRVVRLNAASKPVGSHWVASVGRHTTGNHSTAADAAMALKSLLLDFTTKHHVEHTELEALAFSMLAPPTPEIAKRRPGTRNR